MKKLFEQITKKVKTEMEAARESKAEDDSAERL